LVGIGVVVGVIGTRNQRTEEARPEVRTFVDKITEHPVIFTVNGIVTGMIIGTPIGGWLGNPGLGWIIGGVIGLVLSIVFILSERAG
jgi:hypothetical protein